MIRAQQPISNASFTKVILLFLIKLHKREVLKKIILISVVVLSALTRYIVLSADKNLVKQNKQALIRMR